MRPPECPRSRLLVVGFLAQPPRCYGTGTCGDDWSEIDATGGLQPALRRKEDRVRTAVGALFH